MFPARPVQPKPLATPEERPRTDAHDNAPRHAADTTSPDDGAWAANAGLLDAFGVNPSAEPFRCHMEPTLVQPVEHWILGTSNLGAESILG